MRLLREAGQTKRANVLLAKQLAFANQLKGRLFALNFGIANGYLRNGDINTAESYVARNRALLTEAQRWPKFPLYGMAWQALVEDGNARLEEARGRFLKRRATLQGCDTLPWGSLKTVSQWESKPPEGDLERSADWALALEGRAKGEARQRGEGEADVSAHCSVV
jgi:hypothetical protein